jgi:hypothetical protein
MLKFNVFSLLHYNVLTALFYTFLNKVADYILDIADLAASSTESDDTDSDSENYPQARFWSLS